MKVLLTGSTGFIGSRLATCLRERDYEVWELLRYVSGGRYAYYDRPNRVFADLRDPEQLRKAVDAVKPEVLIHLGAESAVSFSFDHPREVQVVNFLGTLDLARAAQEVGVKHFIFASTSEVYGRVTSSPIIEDQPLGATSPYAVSKIAAEEYLRVLMHTDHFPATIVRPFNSILPGQTILFLNQGKAHLSRVEEVPPFQALVASSDSLGNITFTKPGAMMSHHYEGDVYEITTLGRKVRVTGDHSVISLLDRKPSPAFARELTVGDWLALARRIEMPVSDLTELYPASFLLQDEITVVIPYKGKEYGIPLCALTAIPDGAFLRRRSCRTTIPARIPLDEDLLWLMGLWTAEGSANRYTTSYRVTLSSHKEHLLRAQGILQRLGIRSGLTQSRQGPSLYLDHKYFYLLLQHLGLLGKSRERTIPAWILQLPLLRLKAYLKGLWDGDGTKREQGFEIATSSEKLLQALLVALARFGFYGCILRGVTRFKGKRYTYGRVTAWGIPADPAQWQEGQAQVINPNGRTTIIGDLAFSPITRIDKTYYKGPVWDFSVPDQETFLAGDMVLCHNTYGRALVRNPHFVVERAITQALERGKIELHDPNPWRDFMFREDHVAGYLALVENWNRAVGETFNLCTGGSWQIRQMAETVAKLVKAQTGRNVEVVFSEQPDRPLDIPKLHGSSDKIQKALGWSPRFGFEEGLERAVWEWRQVLSK